jgi:hypothetical protein
MAQARDGWRRTSAASAGVAVAPPRSGCQGRRGIEQAEPGVGGRDGLPAAMWQAFSLRFANERRVEFAGYDAQTRVARVLRELAAAYGERSGNRVTLNWPLTQTELASLSSVAEPTVQKALRRLRESGVIATGYRSLTIQDLSELNELAGA